MKPRTFVLFCGMILLFMLGVVFFYAAYAQTPSPPPKLCQGAHGEKVPCLPYSPAVVNARKTLTVTNAKAAHRHSHTVLQLKRLRMTVTNKRLPNHVLTPGAVTQQRDLKEICTTSTKTVRHTSEALKKVVCAEYHVANCPKEGAMEIDHLVPLELDGDDVQRNLWVQMAPDYHVKDKLEDRLHSLVCAGKMKLDAAQYCISSDWTVCYQKTFGVKP